MKHGKPIFCYLTVDITVSITTSGTNTTGETYSLVCYITVTGSTDQPTITWLDPMNNTVPFEMVSTTGNMSTLTFNPLAASHAGTYTCRAMVGSVVKTASVVVTVQSECCLVKFDHLHALLLVVMNTAYFHPSIMQVSISL